MKSLANEFFSTMAKGAEAHQAAHAEDYELIVNGIKDERDLARQVSLVVEQRGARGACRRTRQPKGGARRRRPARGEA